MLKFFRNCLFIALPFLVWNFLYLNTAYWKTENRIEKFFAVPEGIQLANIGSSHEECGLLYDEFKDEYTSFNFALAGQYYEGDINILNQYIGNMTENSLLIVPISYSQVNGIISESEFIKQKPRYYRILKKEFMPEWKLGEYVRYVLFPIVSSSHPIKNIIHDAPVTISGEVSVADEPQRLLDDAEDKFNRWLRVEDKEKGIQHNFENLCRILDLCKEHNVKTVLLTTPVTDKILEKYENRYPEFFESYDKILGMLKSKYPDIKHFDYSKDRKYISDYSLFMDSDHMNFHGAKVFTKDFLTTLKEEGILN